MNELTINIYTRGTDELLLTYSTTLEDTDAGSIKLAIQDETGIAVPTSSIELFKVNGKRIPVSMEFPNEDEEPELEEVDLEFSIDFEEPEEDEDDDACDMCDGCECDDDE